MMKRQSVSAYVVFWSVYAFLAQKWLSLEFCRLKSTNNVFIFVQEATGRVFNSSRFIESLQDGVLLC